MRLKFRKQASKLKPELASSRISFWQGLMKIASLTSGLLLLISIGSNREFAQAETARIDNITVERQPDETYESLIGRAEAAARSAVAQGFEQGNSVTDVSVVILGQNQGIIAPLLVVELSRPQWNDRSTQSGVTYFNSARSLLRLDPEQANSNQAPGQGNPPAPPQAQQNNSTPRSSREVINRTPNQQVPPTLPGATSSPGTQQPTNTPVTSPGNTSTPNNNNTTPIPSPTPVSSPTPISSPTPVSSPAQITSPNSVNGSSPQNLPQGTPNNTNTTTDPGQL